MDLDGLNRDDVVTVLQGEFGKLLAGDCPVGSLTDARDDLNCSNHEHDRTRAPVPHYRGTVGRERIAFHRS